MKSAIAIRHVHFEDLGAFAPALARAGYEIGYLDAGVHDLKALRPEGPDLLIVLGGPIGAHEEAAYPFLADEIDLLQARMAANRPTMGICLGAQLIARAAGARVYAAEGKEIGFAPVRLTDAGRTSCLAPFDAAPLTLHWHGDTFDLPQGALRLASTGPCENQAFSLGANVIGFQFHPEAGAGGFENWLIGHACELGQAGLDPAALRRQARELGPELAGKADQVATSWLAGLETE